VKTCPLLNPKNVTTLRDRHVLGSPRWFKHGKEHRYWSIVESRRCAGGNVVQRPVIYLGEITDTQKRSWCRILEGFDDSDGTSRQTALFAWDRKIPAHTVDIGIGVRLKVFTLHRPRQWGACWLACQLYSQLDLVRLTPTATPTPLREKEKKSSPIEVLQKARMVIQSSPRFSRWLAWRRWCLSKDLEKRGSNIRMSWNRVPGMPIACRLRFFLHASS
jgi:hypothetical protein